eukprot:826463_1
MGTCCACKRNRKQSAAYTVPYTDNANHDTQANNNNNRFDSNSSLDVPSPKSNSKPVTLEIKVANPGSVGHLINEKLSSLHEAKQDNSPLPETRARMSSEGRQNHPTFGEHKASVDSTLAAQSLRPVKRQNTFLALKQNYNYTLSFEKKRDVTQTVFQIRSNALAQRVSILKAKGYNALSSNIIHPFPLDYREYPEIHDDSFFWSIFMFKGKNKLSRGYFKILDYVDDNVQEYEGGKTRELKITKLELQVFLYFVHHPTVRNYLGIRDREMWDHHDITIYIDQQQYTLKFFNGKELPQCQTLSIVKILEPMRQEPKPVSPKGDEKSMENAPKPKPKSKQIYALYFPKAIEAIEWRWYDTRESRFIPYQCDELQSLEFDASYYANIKTNFPISNLLFRSDRTTSIFDHCYLPRFSTLIANLSKKKKQKYCMRYTLLGPNDTVGDCGFYIDQINLKSRFTRSVERYFDRHKYLKSITTRKATIHRVLSRDVDDVGFMVTSLRRDTYIEDMINQNAPVPDEGHDTITSRASQQDDKYQCHLSWIATYDSASNPHDPYHIILTSNFDKSRTSQFTSKRVKDEHMEFITVNIKTEELVSKQCEATHMWARFKMKRRNSLLPFSAGFWDVSFNDDEDDGSQLLRQHLDAILSTLQHNSVLNHFHLHEDDPDFLWAEDDEKAVQSNMDQVIHLAIDEHYEYELLWYNAATLGSEYAMVIRQKPVQATQGDKGKAKKLYLMYFPKPTLMTHWQWYDNNKCEHFDYTEQDVRMQLECGYLSNEYRNYPQRHMERFWNCIFTTFNANRNVGNHKCYVLKYRHIPEMRDSGKTLDKIIINQTAYTNDSDYQREVRRMTTADLQLEREISNLSMQRSDLSDEKADLSELFPALPKLLEIREDKTLDEEEDIIHRLTTTMVKYENWLHVSEVNKQGIVAILTQIYKAQELQDTPYAVLVALRNDFSDFCNMMQNVDDPQTKMSEISDTINNTIASEFGHRSDKCLCVRRTYRDRTINDSQQQYFGFDDKREVIAQQLLDSYHCFLLHTLDTKRDEIVNVVKHIPSFATEGDMGSVEAYDDPGLDREISAFFERSSSLVEYTETKQNKKKFNTTGAYDCGFRFYYWKYYKYSNEKRSMFRDYVADPGNKGYQFQQWYIEPIHKDLKEELLVSHQHFAYSIGIDQYREEYQKAQVHLASDDGKRLICNSSDWERMYELKMDTRITLSHLLSMQLYCSFVEAARCFMDTFSKTHQTETDKELKARHSKCAWWAKYLRESVEGFGVKLRQRGRHETYYHGITDKFLFANAFLRFNVPLSTTTDERMMEHLLDDNGMVLALKNDTLCRGNLRVWDCAKYSDFPWESEHLFVGGLEALMVYDIKPEEAIGVKGNTCLEWIQAMNNIHQIFDGMACRLDVNARYIRQLIDYQLKRSDGDYKGLYEQYVARLFDSYCEDTREVTIRLSLMDQSHKKISDILMDKDRLNLLKIIKLFPHCARITLCDGYRYPLVPDGADYDDTILKSIEHCIEWVCDQRNYNLQRIVLQTTEAIQSELWKKHADALTLSGWECKESKSNEDEDDDDMECEYRISRSRKSIAATRHGDDCEAIQRIWSVLTHYEQAHNQTDGGKYDQLIQYCEAQESLLNDWIHIVSEHENDLKTIVTAHEHEPHNIEHCPFAQRHYFEEHKLDVEQTFLFYRNLLDTIHCHIYHTVDIAQMVTKDAVSKGFDTNGLVLDVDHDGESEREKLKYNLKLNKKQPKQDEDGVMDGVASIIEQQEIAHEDKRSVLSLLVNEEYDTEAMTCDVADQTQSNIAKKSSDCFDALKDHVLMAKSHAYTFCVGYRFHYEHWSQQKEVTTPQNELHTIRSKYGSLKEEILQNESFTLNPMQLQQVMIKCDHYMKTEKVKTIVCCMETCEYDLKQGDTIPKAHLLCLILYCDCTQLQKHFSATFRKKDWFESIKSLMKRHSEFAIWARLLRESIEVFGMDGHCQHVDENGNTHFPAQGPFYCGMSHVMVMPQFNISLFCPTSTTKQESVAWEFAGDDGIVIQLSNNGENDNLSIKSFSCAWLSGHPRESEWLFCGGRHKMQIENVTLTQGVRHPPFAKYFRVFFYFDCMLNGSRMDFPHFNINAIQLKHEHYTLLNHFIRYEVERGNVDKKDSIDSYLYNTFKAFTVHKTQIVMFMHQIKTHLNRFAQLILHPDTTPNRNVLHPVLFELFPNIEQITIHSSHVDAKDKQYYEYGFDLLSLLDVVSSFMPLFTDNNLKIIIKVIRNDHDCIAPPWTSEHWMDESHDAKVTLETIQSDFDEHELAVSVGETGTEYHLSIGKKAINIMH